MCLGETRRLALQHRTQLEAHVRRAFAAEMAFKLDLAIVSGTGAGTPERVLNSPAVISVAKDTGQAAATITPGNIENMWARMAAPARKRAV